MAIALEGMTRMANSLNIVNGEVWDRLNSEKVPSLLELRAPTQAVVSFIPCKLLYENPTFVCLSYLSLLCIIPSSSCAFTRPWPVKLRSPSCRLTSGGSPSTLPLRCLRRPLGNKQAGLGSSRRTSGRPGLPNLLSRQS